jgi:hypothetical protein
MKSSLLLLFTFLLVKHSFTQDTSFIIEAGKKVNDVIPAKMQYQYREFLNGKVFFRDGNVFEGKLNYSRLMDEMQYTTEGGDTLALDNEPTVKFVCIDKDTFCFDHGFVMLIKGNDAIKLAIKHGFRLVDMKKAAGYDMMSSTSSVSSVSSLNDGTISHQLTVKGQMKLSEVAQYYFGNKYGHFVLATKKNLIDLSPHCMQLKHFLKANHINFSKRNDLERVVSFLGEGCK